MKFFLAFFYILGLSFALCSLLGGGFMQSGSIEAGIFDAHPEVEFPEESASIAFQVLMSVYWPSILMALVFLVYFGICACLQAGSEKTIDLIGWGSLLLFSVLSIYSGTRTLEIEELSRIFATLQIAGGAFFVLISIVGVCSGLVKHTGSTATPSAAH